MSSETSTVPPEAAAAAGGLPFDSPEELREIITKFAGNGRTFKDFTALTPESMEVFYMVAYNQYNAGKYEDAEKVFRLLCVLDHFETKFWKGLGACRENMKDHEGAIQAYGYLTMMDMHDPYPPFHAAKNLLALGRVKDAKGALQAAIFNSQEKEDHAELHQQAVNLMEVVEKGEKTVEEEANK